MKTIQVLFALMVLLNISLANARSEQCRSAWTKTPATETKRLVVFRHNNLLITDPEASFSVLEGDDCVHGYIIDSLNVKSVVKMPDGSGVIENSASCKTQDLVGYREDEFPNYNFLRQVFNGPNPPGVVEMDLSQPDCGVRYFPDLQTYRARFRGHFCKGLVGQDTVAYCQHFRHLRTMNR